MGRYVFRLPDVGEGIAEAELVGWHVHAGDAIAEDAPLVDVMTDKATVEIPSPRAGRVVSTLGEPGDKIRVGTELVVFEVEGEVQGGREQRAPPRPAPAQPKQAASPPPPVVQPHARPEPPPPEPTPAPAAPPGAGPRMKPLASPAVRQRAYELGVPLQFVPGTGPGGRVSHADLDAFAAAGGLNATLRHATAQRRRDVEEIRIIGLRRRIAERMQESKRRIPHYSYVEEVDVTALEDLRAGLNARHGSTRPRLTVLPFLARAIVQAVPRFPVVNALFDDEAGIVRRHGAAHVGIATQTPQGLVVPVLRHAETLDLWETAAEISRLSTAAREGKATRDELTGSTITITSLGALGGIVATPVINYPEVAIIGVNRIAERPVVREGQIVIRKMMNLSSSFDHRVVDGWDAAEFIQALKLLLEQPATLFID
jgi:2-oxoisovalerate dehydrogenase E2 component (dihydrolipoyl transacylase)